MVTSLSVMCALRAQSAVELEPDMQHITLASHTSLAFEGSATARLGVRDFEIHWISSGFRISEWISGFQSGFLDFKVDFWISKWISGFKVDFWISKRISGFQSGFLEGFLDFKPISGFQSGFLDLPT